jgi:hypothetical protein
MTYAPVIVKASMVIEVPTAEVTEVNLMSPEVTPTDPSIREREVLDESLSTALAWKRNQPIVPAATPVNLQVSPEALLTVLPEGAPKFKPFDAEPSTNAPPLTVMSPKNVPVGASSAVAGWAPV